MREMEQSIRGLSDQVKALSAQVAANTAASAAASTPRTKVADQGIDYSHLRQVSNVPSPSNSQYVNPYPQTSSWVGGQMQQQQQPQPVAAQLGLQQMHPPPMGPAPAPKPPVRQEDWDETFLSTLGLHDQVKLRELLMRAPHDVVMPVNQPSPLSQTVILALVHRVRH